MLRITIVTVVLSGSITALAGCRTPAGVAGHEGDVLPASAPPVATQFPVESITRPLDDVCHLATNRRNFKRLWFWTVPHTGSAALVEGRYLITAAHNVADYAGWNRLVRLNVSCNTRIASDGTVDVRLSRDQILRQVATPRYDFSVTRRGEQWEHDYAFVDLGRVLSDRSWFTLSDSVIPQVGEAIFLGGYPGQAPVAGDSVANGRTLYRGHGTVTGIDENLITYDIPAETGNSGGPLWIVRHGSYYIVAVHVTEGTGRLFNANLHDAWRAWRGSRTAANASAFGTRATP